MDVQGKVAIVTGGARGLGKGYAKALLIRGAKVVITDILVEEGVATEGEFTSEYGRDRFIYVKGDVTKQEDMEAVFNTTTEQFGTPSILINNAGLGIFKPPQQAYDVNVFAVMRCCDLAVPRMDKEKGGQGGVIINISSMAGLYTFAGCPTYISSKHALAGYTGAIGKSLANRESGIRVVGICPGFVKTPLTRYTQEKEAAGDEVVCRTLKACGGWTAFSLVVDCCMQCIETVVPSGSLVKVDNQQGIKLAKPEGMPLLDMP